MTNPKLYQCPYEAACQCSQLEPCNGCETWAAFHADNGSTLVVLIGSGMVGMRHFNMPDPGGAGVLCHQPEHEDDNALLHMIAEPEHVISFKSLIDDDHVCSHIEKQKSHQSMIKGKLSKRDRRK